MRLAKIDSVPGGRNVKKMLAFPIGERFALISITAALFSARVTLIALLVLGRLRGRLHAEWPHPAVDRAVSAVADSRAVRPAPVLEDVRSATTA